MTRLVNLVIDGQVLQKEIPASENELMPDVFWGDPWKVFTPAYWLTLAWMKEAELPHLKNPVGEDGLVDQLGFCMLGGYGITAEVNAVAFERCREAGLFSRLETNIEEWRAVLSSPFDLNGKKIRYRYPNQKSKYLSSAMAYLRTHRLKVKSGLSLRNQLLSISGIGYKTASWIVRNVFDSDEVAILDIHLIRAGRLCGLFSTDDNVQRDYLRMEERFLTFSHILQIRPSILDYLIWDEMRNAGSLPLERLRKLDGNPELNAKEKGSADRQTQLPLAV